ncbi:MAG TPA: outer membrane beta-barrel protein [Azospirillaceae bacterium]|nr:outer membrane beta-barrel protein [Azospirillaceae bacterium]
MISKFGRIALGAGLAAFAAGPALAQGGSGWTGGYVGVHAGYGFQSGGGGETVQFDTNLDGAFTDTVRTGAGADAFSPGFCGATARGRSAAEGCRKDDDGYDLGLRAGFDSDLGGLVLGGVVDVSYIDVQDGVTAFSVTPASYSFSRELELLAAARLRAGFGAAGFLVYATGGGAWGEIDHSFATTNAANSFTPRGGDDAWGYQIGAGAETMFAQGLSVGVEYLYTTLKDKGYVVRTGPGTAPPTNPFLLVNPQGTDMRRAEKDFDFSTVRLTVTYRFGG